MPQKIHRAKKRIGRNGFLGRYKNCDKKSHILFYIKKNAYNNVTLKALKNRYYFLIIVCFSLVFCDQSQAQCNNFSGYFGGSFSDEIHGVTRDGAGNIYFIGLTQSQNLLIKPGKISDTLSGTDDGFILKTDSCGNYIWSTYIGGSGSDACEKITFYNNKLYITGYTSSANFPVTSGSFMDTLQGSYDSYILVLDTACNILWGSYFGGTGGDFSYDIEVDQYGNFFAGGSSSSTDLPTNASSFQMNKSGAIDAFVVRFNNNYQFNWCTYYGGSFGEDVHALCIDKWGNLIMTGGTLSNNLNTSVGAQQNISAGGMDCYIIKLDSMGNRTFSTYYGGMGVDDSYGIDTDSSGVIYIAGNTNSSDYPVTASCYQNNIAGSTDIHLDAFSSTGLNLWSTYFGGADIEEIRDLHVINEEIILLGRTQSNNFPVMGNPIQTNLNGSNFDLAFMKFSKNGLPFYSTYYGGTNEETGQSFVNNKHSFYLGGTSYSTDYPNNPLPFQNNMNGVNDGILSKFFIPLSITEIQTHTENEWTVFPNPASDYIMIRNNQIIDELILMEMSGAIIYQAFPQQIETKLNLSQFANGIYYLSIKQSNGNCLRKKIILSK